MEKHSQTTGARFKVGETDILAKDERLVEDLLPGAHMRLIRLHMLAYEVRALDANTFIERRYLPEEFR